MARGDLTSPCPVTEASRSEPRRAATSPGEPRPRDANANDLTDFLDMRALAAKKPTFPKLPPLAKPGDTAAALACSASGAGTVPPPGSISG